MADTSYTDILQDRTQKYRRNFFILSIILIAVYGLELDFGEFRAFGITITAKPEERQRLVLSLLWLAWFYEAWMFARHAALNWRDWRSKLSEERKASEGKLACPERMYFPQPPLWFYVPKLGSWCGPSKKLTDRYIGSSGTWEIAEHGGAWTGKGQDQNGNDTSATFSIGANRAKAVRSRIWWFLAVDCLIPAALGVWALAYGFCDIQAVHIP